MLKPVDIKYFKLIVGQEALGKETQIDISARCPVCGDSKKSKRSKRLHLYEKGGTTLVNCFNGDCNVHHNVWNFIKMTKPELLDQYKRETFGNQIDRLRDQDVKKPEPKQLDSEQCKIVFHDLTSFFKPLEESPETIEYLEGRKIFYNPELFGKWYYGFQDLRIGEGDEAITYKITNAVIIPLYCDGKMYAFYSRSIGVKYFCTYNPEQNIGYKVWNWFNIDKERPVYIFESIFDAISSGKKNIIALMGAKLPDDRLKEMKQPIFCLDNDKTGKLNGVNYAKQGHMIFIIPDSIKEKDMNEIVKNHPDLDINKFIEENTYKGMRAIVRLKKSL